jgi:hypothetical protein
MMEGKYNVPTCESIVKTPKPEESINEILCDIENTIPDIANHSYVIRSKISGTEPCCEGGNVRTECLIARLRDIRSQLREIDNTLNDANASL